MSLPNFLIVGAMRSGTTTLFHHLSQHPQAFLPPQKEVHFFDLNYNKGVTWYEKQFSGAKGQKVIGEGTQTYMYLPEVAPRIAALLGDIKLIAILRNPVERAYSHYWHNRSRGIDPLPFAEAIAAESERLKAGDPSRRMFSYVDRGRYVHQLRRLCEHFSRENLHVILFDDLKKSPMETFQTLCGFLGIDTTFVPPDIDESINQFVKFRSVTIRERTLAFPSLIRSIIGKFNTVKMKYEPMEDAIVEQLHSTFREDNLTLQSWLGRDLSFWET